METSTLLKNAPFVEGRRGDVMVDRAVVHPAASPRLAVSLF